MVSDTAADSIIILPEFMVGSGQCGASPKMYNNNNSSTVTFGASQLGVIARVCPVTQRQVPCAAEPYQLVQYFISHTPWGRLRTT